MKKLITLILFLITASCFSQKYTLLQINAKWNNHNSVEIPKLHDIDIKFAYLEDQPNEIKSRIKAVPIVILYKDSRPVHQWTANLSFKLNITEIEIRRALLDASKN